MKTSPNADAQNALVWLVKRVGGQRRAAALFDTLTTQGHLSLMIHGKRTITPAMAERIHAICDRLRGAHEGRSDSLSGDGDASDAGGDAGGLDPTA